MLTLPPGVGIFAAVEPVDARKSFDGLAAVVGDSLGGDPMTGHMFFFLNRRGDMAQILFWDRTGFVVMRKCLEAGTFRLVRNADGNKSNVEIDAAELGLMLEGIDLGTVKRRKRFKWEPQSTMPVPRPASPRHPVRSLRDSVWAPKLLTLAKPISLTALRIAYRRHVVLIWSWFRISHL